MKTKDLLLFFSVTIVFFNLYCVYNSVPSFEIDRKINHKIAYVDSKLFCYSSSGDYQVDVDSVSYCMDTKESLSVNKGFFLEDCPPFELLPNNKTAIVNVTSFYYSKSDVYKPDLIDCALTLINHIEAGVYELRPKDSNKKSWNS